MNNLNKTLALATQAHANQVRKHSNLPYIVHPIQVMTMLSDWGIRDENMWMAALLHDVIEDQPNKRPFELESASNSEVVNIVLELTFLGTKEEKPEYMKSWLKKDDNGYKKSVESLVIKIADRICNVKDFKKTDISYAKKYRIKAEALFDAMFERQEEIKQKFNDVVFLRMKDEYLSLLNS